MQTYSFAVTADNENDAGGGTADGDFGTSGAYTASNKIEFNVKADYVGKPTAATLTLTANDVDPASGSDPNEQDAVYVNGKFAGYLTLASGNNNVESTTVLNLDPSWLKVGNNLVQVYNTNDPSTGTWNFSVDSANLALTTDPTAAETRINTTTAGYQIYPATAQNADGSYIVVYASGGSEQGGATLPGKVWFQRFDAQGRPVHADGVTAGFEEVVVNSNSARFESQPSVAFLNDGKFVVAWSSITGQYQYGSEDVSAQLFSASGVAIGSEISVPATTGGRQDLPTAVPTSDGGFIITWGSDTAAAGDADQSSYRSYGQRFDGTGAFVTWSGASSSGNRAQTLLNTTTDGDQGSTSAVALDGGKTLVLYISPDADDTGIDAKIFDADGSVAAAEFRVNDYTGSSQRWPHAAKLSNGDIVVVWESYYQDGSTWGVYGRVVHPDGTFATPEFRVNTTVGGEQGENYEGEGPRVLGLADGTFAVAWTSNDGDGRGIFTQRFDATAHKIGTEAQTNFDFASDQATPVLVSAPNGYTVIYTSQAGSVEGGANGTVSAYGIVSRTVELQSNIVATGGETVVNAIGTATLTNPTFGNQERPEIASAADGRHVVVWQTDSSLGNGDGNAKAVMAQLYAADGTAVGAQFQVNTTTTNSQYAPHVTWLDGANSGKFVVAWSSGGQNNGYPGGYARVFNADGSAASTEFAVFPASQTNYAYQPSVSALHGSAAGGFVISWNDGPGAISAQRFDTAMAKSGSVISVAASSGGVIDGNDSVVTGLADGGFLVHWSPYIYQGDLLARRYDSSGTAVAGVNGDGSVAPATGPFTVNTTTNGYTGADSRSATVLTGGGYVIIWQAYAGDGDQWSVQGQLYNADGSLRGHQFRVNTAGAGIQADAEVTALADGSFVVTYISSQADDPSGYDIYAKRFDASGHVLNDEFRVDQTFSVGDQRWPTVAATPTGFIVAWQDQSDSYGAYSTGSADGSGNAIVQQAFTIDGLNATSHTAHAPTLTVAPATGHETVATTGVTNGIALNVTAALNPSANGNEAIAVEVNGIPVGATLSDGNGHFFTATLSQTATTLTGWTLSGLKIAPKLNDDTDFTLGVRVSEIDSVTHDMVTTTASLPVIVTNLALPEALDGPAQQVNSYETSDQYTVYTGDRPDRQSIAAWADGSYVVVWNSNGQDGDGWGVYAQKFSDTGQPVGSEIRVNQVTASEQAAPAVLTLANGSFVVTYTSYNQSVVDNSGTSTYSLHDVYARTFDSSNVGGAEFRVNSTTHQSQEQNHPYITAIGSGYIISWDANNQDNADGNYGVYAQRFTAAGVKVDRDGTTTSTGTSGEFLLNTTTVAEQSWPAITQTADGGFVAVWNSYNQESGTAGANTYGIFGQRFTSAGVASGAEFQINTIAAGSQYHPQIAAIQGGYVVVWEDDTNDGSGLGLFGQIYNTDGSSRGGQFSAGGTFTYDSQYLPSIIATPSGGFIVGYTGGSEDPYGNSVQAQEFDNQGHRLGDVFFIDPTRQNAQEYGVSLAATPTGFVSTFEENTANGLGDGDGYGVFAKRASQPLHTEIAVGGQNQVNTGALHEQTSPKSATLSNGDYIIVYQSKPYPSSSADHDNSDWGVYAERYNASGQKLAFNGSALTGSASGETLINTATDLAQSQPNITALDGGGFVVVWQSSTGDDSGYAIHGQRYDATGVKLGAEFTANVNTTGNQYTPSVADLHGANAGGFVVAWYDEYSNSDVKARVYDASGAAVGATDITLNAQTPYLNGADSTEYNVQVAGMSDGGFVAVWRDDNTDGSGTGVFGQRYSVSLGAGTVTPATSAQPDGTTTTSNFRVNSSTYGGQRDPSITELNDGKFVVVWTDDSGKDGANEGVFGQLFNADGTRNGGEFQVNTAITYTQDEPQVTALTDGGFAVAWRSTQYESYSMGFGQDIYARRFDSAGHAVDEQFRVNTTQLGDQDSPTLTKTANGFVVAWNTPADSAGDPGVYTQRYQFDPGPGAGGTAGTPTLTTAPATGAQDTAIALSLTAALNDPDGSTPETLRIEVSRIPIGAVLSDGAGNHSFTATATSTEVDVAGWSLGSLKITPPTGSTAPITLNVTAIATEAGGDLASTTTTLPVTVTPVAAAQAAYNVEFNVDTVANTSQPEPRMASFADGSFVTVWQKNGVPGTNHASDAFVRLFNVDGTPKSAGFAVAPTTGAFSAYYNEVPTVAVLKNGDFVVAWQTSGITDGDGYEIVTQRFSSTGAKLNADGTSTGTPGPLLLSTGTDGAGGNAHTSDQRVPSITALADGGYIVAWNSYNEDAGAGTWGIYAKRISASGALVQMKDDNGTLSDVIQVNHATAGDQDHPSVVQLTGGDIVFSYDSPDASGGGTFYRIYNASSGFGAETQVNAYTTGEQSSFNNSQNATSGGSTMTALANGGFVMTWTSDGQDGSNWGIYAKVFKADGTFDRAEFRVNSYSYDSQEEPQVTTLADGGFMVTWSSANQDGSSWGVYAQRYTAAGDKVGTEFRLNDTVSGDQSTPTVLAQANGSGVVFAWEDGSVGSYNVTAKRIQLTDAGQQAAIETAGNEQQVNVVTDNAQDNAAITKLSDGSYVVAWQSNGTGSDAGSYEIYARHYDASGAGITWSSTGTAELKLNAYTNSTQDVPSVVALKDGSFVASWESYSQDGSGYGVYARHFSATGAAVAMVDAAGTAVTTDLLVNTTTVGSQNYPQLTALKSTGAINGVAVTWQSPDGAGNGNGVFTKQLSVVTSGANTGLLQVGSTDIQVNSHVVGEQINPVIATLSNGGYVVSWQSDQSSDGSGNGVYGQLFNADGTKSGAEFLINSYTNSEQTAPSITGLAFGGFVVVYNSYNFDGYYWAIAGQRFDNAGNAVGPEFQVNAVARDSQTNPSVTAAQDGGFIVTWQSDNTDSSGTGIAARRFDSNGVATDPANDDVFVNTYGLNGQFNPTVAALDRGFVVAWTSDGQDGSSYGIEMQRFQGQGLQPPPLIVSKTLTPDGVHVFANIQDAINAAANGDTIEVYGGATAGAVATYTESLTTNGKSNLQIQNHAGTYVAVTGVTGGAALTVQSGQAITLRGDAATRLVFTAGANASTAINLAGPTTAR